MFDPNVAAVLERIGADDVVLDIGGWARCFNRANYVMDGGGYEDHGKWYLDHLGLGPQGGDTEHFHADSWIRRDICHRERFPFEDKSIDFCICSHTLEDIRDPIWVCSEMNRIAKRGYIEVPSPVFELSRGRESGVPVGLSHHRWIVDIRDSTVVFLPKHHSIHGDPRYSLPRFVWEAAPPEHQVSWLFWEGELCAGEHALTKEDASEMVISLWMRETSESRDEVLRRVEVFAEIMAQADVLQTRPGQLEQQLAEALQRGNALQARLDQYSDLGPTAIDVTRRLRRISRGHPKLSAIVKQFVKVA